MQQTPAHYAAFRFESLMKAGAGLSRQVIMVHGAFCGGWAFDAFRQPFEVAGFDVTAMDLPGHGKVEDRSRLAGASMADYAAAIAAQVKACAEPPVLIGHSLGGLAVQLAAARAPVRGLILLAPSAPWGVAGSTLEEGASSLGLFALGPFWTMAVDPDYTLARNYSLDRMSSEARRSVYGRMGPESGLALWQTLNWWTDPFMTTMVPAGRIKAPVLALAGGRDLIHPPVTVRQTAARLSGEVQVFDEMSHWLIGEPGWEQVAETCLRWIGRL
jgi:pimeloyl-ACP methyl ester carboxylesterase